MEFIVVTGLSGAGKSKAIEILEDIDFYCIDNMPPVLIPKFAEICFQSRGKLGKVAIVTDVRVGGDLFSMLLENLDHLKKLGYHTKILFLDAADGTLLNRYKESRRRHPLSVDGQLDTLKAISKEREILKEVRLRADYVIDTSKLMPTQLKEQLLRIFVGKEDTHRGLVVHVMSFGFKYGLPIESDLVFDVRFLPNPFYVDELKNKTGLDQDVYDYVFQWPQAKTFETQLTQMIEFLIPHYIAEGKTSLVISIGCTGGKHRSVSMARRLSQMLEQNNYYTVINHRDITKGSHGK